MYAVRAINSNVFEVAKFEDRNFPVDVYTIKKGKCNCPASWRSTSCKHSKLVEEFKKDTTKVFMFDFNSKNEVVKFETHNLTVQ